MKAVILSSPCLFLSTLWARTQHNYNWAHSLYSPYISNEGQNNNWDFDALINMYDFVQLTPELPYKRGWAFTKEKLEAENWTVDFFFRITGKIPADGMAFWFSEDRYQSGTAFGYKENFKGLGVFFDAFENTRTATPFPWISVVVGDGVRRYNHDTDGVEHSLGGCHKNFLNTNHPVQARVTYHNRILEVSVKVEEEDWSHCIRLPNVVLPKAGYVGFTAATGALAARHELLAVTTATLVNDGASEEFETRSSSTKFAFAKWFALAFVISGLASMGLKAYQRERKAHRF